MPVNKCTLVQEQLTEGEQTSPESPLPVLRREIMGGIDGSDVLWTVRKGMDTCVARHWIRPTSLLVPPA
jgi:hypothetical protein